MTKSIQEICEHAAEVLRSSERMVQRNWDIFQEHPDDEFYDPDWAISLEQDEAKGLLRNLSDAAKLFDVLAGKGGGS